MVLPSDHRLAVNPRTFMEGRGGALVIAQTTPSPPAARTLKSIRRLFMLYWTEPTAGSHAGPKRFPLRLVTIAQSSGLASSGSVALRSQSLHHAAERKISFRWCDRKCF